MSINKSCQLLGHARSTFFEVRKNRQIKLEKERLLEQYVLGRVTEIRKEMPRLGGKKLYFLINQDVRRQQFKFGEQRFFEILRKKNLLVKKKKKYTITTDSKLWRGQFDDLLKGVSITHPEQIWVADITYFRTQEGFIYGHLITDAYCLVIKTPDY